MKTLASFFHFLMPKSEATAPVNVSTTTRRVRQQTPEDMLKVLKTAERLGMRTGIDSATKNLFLRGEPSANTPWGFFKTLFSRRPVGIENRDEIVRAVIEKMKDHIRKSEKHVDQVMTEFLPDLGHFAQTGQIGDLENQWARLQNILKQGVDNLKRHQIGVKEIIGHKSPGSLQPIKEKSSSIQQKPVETTTISREDSKSKVAAELISEVNRSLPAAMPALTKFGEKISCTLTVSPEAHLDIFKNLRKWDLHERKTGTAKDDFVGLSEAFFKDSNRTTYVFETDDFSMECERNSTAVVTGFKKVAGPNISRQLLLSHLLGQESLKNMLRVIQSAHPRRDGFPFLLGGESSSDYSRNKIHMTTLANGDIEVDFLSLQKASFLPSEKRLIAVNRSKKFDGPPNRDNAGLCMSMKIRISGASLNRQQLDFKIVKPLTAVVQVEVLEPQAE